MKTYNPIPPMILDGCTDYALLKREYRALLAHHQEELARYQAKDRGLVARMAGNIAGSLVESVLRGDAAPADGGPNEAAIASTSAKLARAILAEVDK